MNGGGISNALLGGWQVSAVYRFSHGIPFLFRSGQCTLVGQFRQSCWPGLKEGANPFLQDVNNFDPGKGPLFDINAFEPLANFNQFGYTGSGVRVTNLRGPNFQNTDFTLIKNIRISERMRFQIRGEFFNAFNSHYFVNAGGFNIGGNLPYDTNIASPNFGRWTGSVSDPRTIQVGGRFEW